jgi:hypothetical protein
VQEHQRGHRAVGGDEALPERREEELAHRARGGGQAHRPGAPIGAHEAREGGDDDRERPARDAEADEDAAGEREDARRGALGHERHAAGIDEPAHREDAAGTPAVGDRAGERLAEAPEEVLEGDRQRERLAVEPARLGEWVGEQPEARPDAEGDDRDEAARDDDRVRAPVPGARRDGHRATLAQQVH